MSYQAGLQEQFSPEARGVVRIMVRVILPFVRSARADDDFVSVISPILRASYRDEFRRLRFREGARRYMPPKDARRSVPLTR